MSKYFWVQRAMRNEKRQLKRVHLIYYLQLVDTVSETEVGHVIDITTKGFMMLSPKPVLTGRDMYFRMQMPVMIIGRENIQFTANSLWCKEDFNPNFYLSGYRIKTVGLHEAETISTLINTCGFKSK